jgi:hypothetical protein
MERARPGWDPGQDVVWVGVRDAAAWAVHLLAVPAAIASVPVVDIRRRTWQDSPAIKSVVRRAVAF